MGSITSREKWPPDPPRSAPKNWEWKIVDGIKKLVRIEKKNP